MCCWRASLGTAGFEIAMRCGGKREKSLGSRVARLKIGGWESVLAGGAPCEATGWNGAKVPAVDWSLTIQTPALTKQKATDFPFVVELN
jgi:hypothetical protein